jgi:hypothetical protein
LEVKNRQSLIKLAPETVVKSEGDKRRHDPILHGGLAHLRETFHWRNFILGRPILAPPFLVY